MNLKTVILIFCILISSAALYPADTALLVKNWGVDRDTAVREYLSGVTYDSFKPYTQKDYANRMFDHIISVNTEIASRMTVIRSKAKPGRELLFIDNRLMMITDEYVSADDFAFKKLFVSLKDRYGIPQMSKEGTLSMYTFKGELATAVLDARGANPYDIRVYTYSKSLFRILFTGE